MESIPVGIDVGTRHSILAIIDDHIGPRVIKNRWGNEKTSSFVGCRHGRLCAAEDALPAVFTYPGGSCVSVKRHIGASQKLRLGGRTFAAEELLQVLLLYLREDAKAYLQAVVRECFIAVPSCFDFKQRDMVKRAAQKAGFSGVKLINEPTAAAMAVSLEGNVLVFDFGAGAVDISAVEKKSDLCHVLESIGSTKFGGMDLDKEIALYIWKLMGERGDPSEDPRWPLLLMEAEAIKESLSFTNVVNWWPRAGGFILHRNKPLAIYREEIESLIAPFILPVLDLAKRTWDRYNCQILLLAGGSARMPLVRRLLAEAITEPEKVQICPDEAIAVGAAVLAGKRGKLFIDVLSCDLAISTTDGGISVIASKGTPLPIKLAKRFMVVGSGSVEAKVLQLKSDESGSRVETLSTLVIKGTRSGDVVKVIFLVDGSGLLRIDVANEKGNLYLSQDVEIPNFPSRDYYFKERKHKIEELERKLALFSYLFDPPLEKKITELFNSVRCLQSAEEDLWQDALAVLESTVNRIAQVVKNK